MEIVVKYTENVRKDEISMTEKEFISEFAKGYLDLDIIEKENQLHDYLEAYDNLRDKDSFNAQYLENLISVLKKEVQELRFNT